MPAPVRIVVASDKFKGSLPAAEVAAALSRGIHRVLPSASVVAVPVADGGDGTLAAAAAAGFSVVPTTVTGPTGEPVRSAYARRGGTAIVELADASGLERLVNGFAPSTAGTLGTGELVAAAVDAGCTEVVLGVGGSCSTDGGAGLAVALGARVLDAAGTPVAAGGAALAGAVSLDLAEVRGRLAGVSVVVATDVDNPLTGPSGAAAVYGPQKGASTDEVALLDAALGHWADLVAATTGQDLRDVPGAGAAGGAGFGAMTLLGAELRSGIETVLELARFDDAVTGADLVVTGEGSLDTQSLRGKAPVGVLAAAGRHGVPVVAVCGRSLLTDDELHAAGLVRTWALSDLAPDVDTSMRDAADLLERVGESLAMAIPELLHHP